MPSAVSKKYKESPNTLTREQKDKLITEYAPVIKFIARKISLRLPPSIELDDLISSGIIGLMDAIEKYDPTRDNKFRTYAEFRIRGAILDELRAQDWVPRSVRDKSKLLERTIVKLKSELGRSPDDNEIAKRLGISLENLYNLMNQVKPVSVVSIDESPSFSNVDRKSILSIIDDCKNPHNKLDKKFIKDIFAGAIEELPERQRLVLSLYYYEDLNLKQIGRVLRVTESRVSQLHAHAITRLKTKLQFILEKNHLPKTS